MHEVGLDVALKLYKEKQFLMKVEIEFDVAGEL